MNHRKEGGWLLLEMIVSLVIGFFIVSGATHFFYANYAQWVSMSDSWHRIEVFEKWRIWMLDALNQEKDRSRCGSLGSVKLQKADSQSKKSHHGDDFMLHSCRWVDQKWQWIDTHYYVKDKGGVSYLYEKVTGKQGVAWIPHIQTIEVHPTHSDASMFDVEFLEDLLGKRVGIKPRFVFFWHD